MVNTTAEGHGCTLLSAEDRYLRSFTEPNLNARSGVFGGDSLKCVLFACNRLKYVSVTCDSLMFACLPVKA